MILPTCPFYFLRHGETDWNVANKIMGQQDIPLNVKGTNQSTRVRSFLNNIHYKVIWSSPLLRARQTTEIINEGLQYPIFYSDNLKERCWGVDEGQSHELYAPDMKPLNSFDGIENQDVPQYAETYVQFQNRIKLVFQSILTSVDQPPLIVAHGGVFCVLTRLLATSEQTAENCELFRFEPSHKSNERWFVKRLYIPNF